MVKIESEAKVIYQGSVNKYGSGTLAISIGKKIREYYNIEQGDLITVAVLNIQKKSESSDNNLKVVNQLNEEKTNDGTTN